MVELVQPVSSTGRCIASCLRSTSIVCHTNIRYLVILDTVADGGPDGPEEDGDFKP